MSRFGSRRRNLVVTFLVAAFTVVAATVAMGAHWPQFGGDAGHSSNQPVAPTGLPVTAKYEKVADTEKNIRTAIVTTAGATTSAQRMVYGTQGADQTAGARIHLQRLSDGGVPAGHTESGTNVDDQPSFDGDTFGDGTGTQSVAPLDTSSATTSGTQYGNIFVVHNDDNQDFEGTEDPRKGGDIAIAQLSAETGQKVLAGIGDTVIGDNQDPSLPNTIGFEIQSSPLITPPDQDGTRSIYFVATRAALDPNDDPGSFPCAPGVSFEDDPPLGESSRGCDIPARTSLFKLRIARAGQADAEIIETKMSAHIANVDADLPPALIRLKSPTAENNPVKDHILISASGTTGTVRAFDGDSLAQVATTTDLGDNLTAPAVPVNADGTLPSTAPYFFVAAGDPGTGTGNEDTIAYRITQKQDDLDTLEFDANTGKSFDLDGNPTAGIAVTKLAGSDVPGRVVLLTSGTGGAGVFSLNADNLRSAASEIPTGAPVQNRAAPVTSGDLVFYTLNNGDQVVRNVYTLEEAPVAAGGFQESATNNFAAGNGSFGQPSVSNRLVQFASDDGAFVYQAGNPAPPPGTNSSAFSIGDAVTAEGNSGEKLITFNVTRFGPSTSTASVKWSTQDGTATAGQDYVAVSGETVTFAPGDTEESISVTILSEGNDENDETFFVNLSDPAPAGAQIVDSQGLGVIVTDDPRRTHPGEPTPLIGISDVVGVEGGKAVFVVSLSNASASTVTVDYGTTDGTAKAGRDYGGGAGKLTYSPGQTVKTISVPLVADRSREVLEDFFMNLSSPANATLGDNQGAGFIREKNYRLPRVAPRRVTASTEPGRDAVAPFRFVTRGRVVLPSGVSRARGCKGKVAVQIKSAPAKTISNRRVKLRRNCRFASTVTFEDARRFPESGKLEVHARFQGNSRLKAKRARKHTVRTR